MRGGGTWLAFSLKSQFPWPGCHYIGKGMSVLLNVRAGSVIRNRPPLWFLGQSQSLKKEVKYIMLRA